MALKTMIDRLVRAREDYERSLAEIGKQARGALKDTLCSLIPEGYGVQWSQYTPYFNDGDACVFRRHEMYIVKLGEEGLEGLDESNSDIEDREFVLMDWELKKFKGRDGLSPDQARDIFELLKSLTDDFLLQACGDHTTVRASSTELLVDDCVHD